MLEFARIIIDVCENPDVYTQIAGISTGIPQINIIETMNVEHKKNGIILNKGYSIEDAINYYFTGLKNWNDSLVYSIDKLLENSGKKLVEKWKNKLGQ